MGTEKPQSSFETVYNDTYQDVLKFIIFKCNNLDDVNDIIQETYMELFKMMKKSEINDIKPFIIGIAKNKIKKYYNFKNIIKNLFVSKSIDDEEMVETIGSNLDLENQVFERITKDEIWEYLRNKNTIIAKIFYLYYAEDITIKEIAKELNLNESTIKNHLYRTLKELNDLFGKDND
jgi:RNA polymerase sigma-70 factor (ECF subfamily)